MGVIFGIAVLLHAAPVAAWEQSAISPRMTAVDCAAEDLGVKGWGGYGIAVRLVLAAVGQAGSAAKPSRYGPWPVTGVALIALAGVGGFARRAAAWAPPARFRVRRGAAARIDGIGVRPGEAGLGGRSSA
jgi:hypothetical protein